MPFRKVWRESRSRFFFILAALLVVTTASVFYNAKTGKVVIESKDFHEAGVRTIRGPGVVGGRLQGYKRQRLLRE